MSKYRACLSRLESAKSQPPIRAHRHMIPIGPELPNQDKGLADQDENGAGSGKQFVSVGLLPAKHPEDGGQQLAGHRHLGGVPPMLSRDAVPVNG
jgi:hypothetical protein